MVIDREKRHWKKAIVNKNPHGFQKPLVERMYFLHVDNWKIKKELTLFFAMKINAMDWFLYDIGLRHERINIRSEIKQRSLKSKLITSLITFSKT